MKTRFAIWLMLAALPATAQLKNFRLSAGGNTTLIADPGANQSTVLALPPSTGYSNYYTGTGIVREDYSSRAGVFIGSSFDVPVHPRFFLRTGLTFSVVNFRRTTTVESLPAFTPTPGGTAVTTGLPFSSLYGYVVDGVYGGRFEVDGAGKLKWDYIKQADQEQQNKIGRTRLFTIQVPLLAGTSFWKDRVTVSAGTVINFVGYASVYRWDPSNAEKHNETDQFTAVSPGAMMALGYTISRRISIEASGQHFFSPIYKTEHRLAEKSHLNTVTAGLSYRIAR
jgi:hypothetical protein